MLPFKRIVIIYNPKSTGPGKKNADRLSRRLRKRLPDVMVDIKATKYAGHAEEIAYNLCRSPQKCLIVSASGDGGYHEVINGVLRASNGGRSRAFCAVLPSGNANDHARATHNRPLLQAIVSGKSTLIDVLQVTIRSPWRFKKVRFAHSYAGIGITSLMAQAVNSKRTNTLKEVGIAMRTVYKLKPYEIEQQGDKRLLYSLVFSNIRQMAKFFKTAPVSSLQDGKFEVSELPYTPKHNLVKNIRKLAMSKLPPVASVSYYSLIARQNMSLQIDGEVLELPDNTKLEIRCLQRMLDSIV